MCHTQSASCANHEETMLPCSRSAPYPAGLAGVWQRLSGPDSGQPDSWRCNRVLWYCYTRMVGLYMSRQPARCFEHSRASWYWAGQRTCLTVRSSFTTSGDCTSSWWPPTFPSCYTATQSCLPLTHLQESCRLGRVGVSYVPVHFLLLSEVSPAAIHMAYQVLLYSSDEFKATTSRCVWLQCFRVLLASRAPFYRLRQSDPLGSFVQFPQSTSTSDPVLGH